MELYTLDQNFRRSQIIDEFISAIWTERYRVAGDVNLVADATPEMVALLAEGTFVGLDGSNEVMLIETQTIEEGKVTATGTTLLDFLRNRMIRTTASFDERSWVVSGMAPGEVLGYIVQNFAIDVSEFGSIIGGDTNNIENLELGAIDSSGADISVAVPFGPVYDALIAIAETYSLGMSLYLDSATDEGYVLKFKVYRGLDRTSEQDDREVVQFSPMMDSLLGLKELRSISTFRNVAYAFTGDTSGGIHPPPGVAYTPGYTDADVGFSRRLIVIFVEDISQELIDEDFGSSDALNAVLSQRAADALANNHYTKVVDGEIVDQIGAQYGIDYMLGDVVELQGHSRITQKARITEYIRSQDINGENEYPTVSAISDEEAAGWYTETD